MKSLIFSLLLLITSYDESNKKYYSGIYVSSKENYCNPKINIYIKKNKNSGYSYVVKKNNLKLFSGKLKIKKNDDQIIFNLKEVAGLYRNDSIIIQNYGNEMNQYINFKNCGAKYLYFIRKRL